MEFTTYIGEIISANGFEFREILINELNQFSAMKKLSRKAKEGETYKIIGTQTKQGKLYWYRW